MKRFKPRQGFILTAHKLALDPNAGQEQALRSHCGAARAAYNWAVTWVLASWNQRRAEKTYGLSEHERTEWRPWSLPALRKEFNRIKHTDPRFASWWQNNSKEAYNTGLANAAAAFDNYTDSRNGCRRGRRMGPPRHKCKRRARLSCRFTTGRIRIHDRRHVVLPRLGRIRVHEDVADLLARVLADDMRILSATVRFERGRWFVAFQVEERLRASPVARPDDTVGVDLGIRALAVVASSTGEVYEVPNPRHLDAALRRLRKASRRVSRRRGPDGRLGREPSERWKRANAERNRIHRRVANSREDGLHKMTAALAREFGTVCVEDLNVAGMGRNHRLARHIADAAFGEIRRQLVYKTRRHGGRLVVADRWFPSSKTCSGCGAAKAKLPLGCRVFDCHACGVVLDRDVNAAFNLAALATGEAATGTGVAGDQGARPRAPKPRGADRKTRRTRARDGSWAGGATPQQRKEARDRTRAATLSASARAAATDLPEPEGQGC